MFENIVRFVLPSLFMVVWILVIVHVIAKKVKSRRASIETVPAVIVDKHIIESFSKYSGNGKSEKYVVVFSVDGKKKGFYVSPFSYDGYRINEKGTLKYKGDELISFD